MEFKLMPCPFCGGIATIETENIQDANVYHTSVFIKCIDCKTRTKGSSNYGIYDKKDLAGEIDIWNRRTK